MAVYDLEEQEQIAALRGWWKQYGGWATGLVLVIALGWLGWYGWQSYLKTQNAEASRVFLVLQQAEVLGPALKHRLTVVLVTTPMKSQTNTQMLRQSLVVLKKLVCHTASRSWIML